MPDSPTARATEEWRQLSWLVGCAVATGLLEDEPPVSMLLLGAPGSGKSSIISRWDGEPSTVTYSDLTSDSLRHHVLPEMSRSRRSHLLLPEFWKLYQRAQPAVQNMVGFLSASMSGELHRVMQGERTMEALPPGFRIGVIGAMTDRVYRTWSKDLLNTGLEDRFLVVSLEISKTLREQMLYAAAMRERGMLTRLTLPSFDGRKVRVHLGEAEAHYFYEVVRGSRAGNRIRFVEQMRAMLKALALIHGEAVVTTRRVEQVGKMMDYILSSKPLEV